MKNTLFFILLLTLVVIPTLGSAFAAAPDPPKLTNGTVVTTNGVFLEWTIPAQNGGAGTVSYNVKRSSDCATFTSLANQTSVGYDDTEPLQATYTCYQLYSTDTGGTSAGYGFPLNQTYSGNVLTHLPYDDVLTDQGTTGNTPSATGGTAYVAGHNGDARSFTGAMYDTIPNESDYDFQYTDPFTISFWIKGSPQTNKSILSKANTQAADTGYGIWTNGANVLFHLTNTAGTNQMQFFHTDNDILDGTWHHIIWGNNGSGTVAGQSFYIDGVAASKTTSVNNLAATILNNLSVVVSAESDGGNPATMSIDDLRIIADFLDESESEQLYNEYLITNDLAMNPHAVTDLTGTSDINLSTITLSWSEPFCFGGCTGNMINYTSPEGDPLTILTNDTGTTTTTAQVLGLSIGEEYSFRVSAWNYLGTNGSGNIFNTTLSTNYEVGNFSSIDITNTDDFSIFFTRDDINSTALFVNVTYPNTYNLTCAMYYQFARQNDTYSNLANTTVDSDNVMSSFEFINATGDIITITCADVNTGDSANYVLTITQFEFLDQITNLKNGTYGTYFKIGAIDGVTLSVIFLAMIGFNRTNPIAGIMFLIITVSALSFFGIITYPIIMYPALALIALWAFISTRKDD